MWSKNKSKPTAKEARHIERIKEMSCAVCEVRGPCDAHEIKQGQWFTAIPLCKDCHTGSLLGLHGERAAWNVRKMDETDALAVTIERLLA